MVKASSQSSSQLLKDASDYGFNSQEIGYFRHRLVSWYDHNRRQLPWRGDTVEGKVPPPMSAYGTWVSEIMAQQTRIATVIPYWHRWMATFPSVHELAAATEEDVNSLWAGLGYYRRARQLLAGAKAVVEQFNGEIPSEIEDLLEIPGIGPYTAGAISSIAFSKANPLVDGNVIRVFARLRAVPYEVGTKQLDSLMWKIAADIVDPDRPGDFNQGLMELGATVCTPQSPTCGLCPLQSLCRAKKIVDRNNGVTATNNLIASKGSTGKMLASRTAPSEDGGVVDLTSDDEKSPLVTDGISKSVDMEDLFLDSVLKPSEKSSNTGNARLVGDSDVTKGDLDCSIDYRAIKDVGFFPLRPSRKRPRDVILSVCVLRYATTPSNQTTINDDVKYLFVRRPDTGLLAKQWEFPNIILYEESDSASLVTTAGSEESDEAPPAATKPPGDTMQFTASQKWSVFPEYFETKLGVQWIPVTTALESQQQTTRLNTTSLCEIPLRSDLGMASDDAKLTHVFSHQRHVMHITVKDVKIAREPTPASFSTSDTIIIDNEGDEVIVVEPNATTSRSRREASNSSSAVEYAWKSGAELRREGITSGCEKILDFVESLSSNNSKSVAKKTSKPESTSSSTSAKSKKQVTGGMKPSKGTIDSFFVKSESAQASLPLTEDEKTNKTNSSSVLASPSRQSSKRAKFIKGEDEKTAVSVDVTKDGVDTSSTSVEVTETRKPDFNQFKLESL